MKEIGLTHKPRRKPNGITKMDKETQKSDDLLKRDLKADKPCEKCITDITKLKLSNGKLYVLAIFYCFDVNMAIEKFGLVQSMNSTGGRCHDNARCESMWARMKEELFYGRNRKSEDYNN